VSSRRTVFVSALTVKGRTEEFTDNSALDVPMPATVGTIKSNGDNVTIGTITGELIS